MNIALRHVRRSTDTSHIEIRAATPDDAPEIARLFGEYFSSTQWQHFLTFDEAKTTARVRELIEGKKTPHLLAWDGDKVIGILSWHYDCQYVAEPIAVMDETYVDPEYRQTDLGRKMVAIALYFAKLDNAAVFNFPIASGLPSTRTLVNLLKKFGGEICGVIVRCKPQGEYDGR
jgi:predicted N-acetyltransferase YhbS